MLLSSPNQNADVGEGNPEPAILKAVTVPIRQALE
jgi:hypothetical protein